MSNETLQALFKKSVEALQAEIPGLSRSIVGDTKHIYAWVKENYPRQYLTDRYDPDKQPMGELNLYYVKTGPSFALPVLLSPMLMLPYPEM